MIGHFPTPLPDELLYSIAARFSDRVKYSNKAAINIELFGTRGGVASIALPSRLHYLTSNLPYTVENCRQQFVDRLIKNHTLFPLYRPFIPTKRIQQIRAAMEGSSASNIQNKAGIAGSSINSPEWLRFCVVCIHDDRQQFGCCYWRRSHQVTGVEVCPVHNVFLSNSTARSRNRINKVEYVSAESVVQPTLSRPLVADNPDHQVLLQVARDVAWLLNNGSSVTSFSTLRDRYQLFLADAGFLKKDGSVSLKQLVAAIQSKYSNSLLEMIQCGFYENKEFNWASFLLSQVSRGNFNPPIRHLLLIQLLGSTAEAFFCRSLKHFRALRPRRGDLKQLKPFGEGPWTCLNPVCERHKKLAIRSCSVKRHRLNREILVGTFACECGFTYTRLGPDDSDTGYRYRVNRYGDVWESYLQKASYDSSISLNEIARALSAKWDVVRRMGVKMNLEFPRQGPIYSVSRVLSINPTHAKLDRSFQAIRTRNRERWLSARKQRPNAGMKLLREQLVPGPYCWLSKHDRDWILVHSPPKRNGSADKVDWKKRDAWLAAEVHAAALRIRKRPGRPVRITRVAIARDVKEHRSLSQKPSRSKLPLTVKALSEVLEGSIDFNVRKIEWAANELRKEGIRPGMYPLRKRAAIEHEYCPVPEIKAALDAALQSLIEADLGHKRSRVA